MTQRLLRERALLVSDRRDINDDVIKGLQGGAQAEAPSGGAPPSGLRRGRARSSCLRRDALFPEDGRVLFTRAFFFSFLFKTWIVGILLKRRVRTGRVF